MATKFPGVVIKKLADKEIPVDFLEKAIEAHGDCAGIATVKQVDEDNNPLDYLGTYLTRNTDEISAKEIGLFLDQNKDRACVLYLGSMVDKAKDENMQPFVAMFDSNGETTMSVYMVGDFSAKAKDERDHSHARQVFERLVLPTINRAAKSNDDDAEKTFTDLASDPTMSEFMNICPDTAVLLVTNEGIVSWGDRAGDNQFDWGWTSDLCGWVAPAKATTTTKSSGFGKKSTTTTTTNPDTNAKPTTSTSQVSLQSSGTNDKPPAIQGPGIEGVNWKWDVAPANYSKAQCEKFYMEKELWTDAGWKSGIKPKNYKDKPRVRVRIKPVETVKSFQEIPKDKVKTTGQVTDESLPVISPNSLDWMKTTLIPRGHVQKTLNEGKVTLDPNRIKKMSDDEWPTFVEAGGMTDLRATMSFLHADKIDLCKKAPDAGAKLIEDLQLALYNLVWKKDVKNNILVFAEPKQEEEPVIEEAEDETPADTGTGGSFGRRSFS